MLQGLLKNRDVKQANTEEMIFIKQLKTTTTQISAIINLTKNVIT